MPDYTVAVPMTIQADNQRDAYDSLDVFLEVVAARAEALGVTVRKPAFEDLHRE